MLNIYSFLVGVPKFSSLHARPARIVAVSCWLLALGMRFAIHFSET